jgi:hypothetical protein
VQVILKATHPASLLLALCWVLILLLKENNKSIYLLPASMYLSTVINYLNYYCISLITFLTIKETVQDGGKLFKYYQVIEMLSHFTLQK